MRENPTTCATTTHKMRNESAVEGGGELLRIHVRPDGYIANVATRDRDHSLVDITRWAAPTSRVKP